MVDAINSNILTSKEFEKDNSLKAQYGSYDNYIAAQLKSTSIHNFDISKLKSSGNPSDLIREFFNKRHEAFNAKSEELIARYQALAPVVSQAKAEYTAYATKINAQNGDPSLTQEAKLNRLKNASSEAEFNYDSALKTALYHTHSATQFLA